MMTVSHPTPAVQFEELDQTIKEVLGETANALARETHFVQRQSKMDGAHFAQALIFGWLTNPEASYGFLQQMLSLSGCVMTELLDRFERVYLQDGTIIGFPNALEPFYTRP